MSNSIDSFRELIKTYERDKLPWVHIHLDDGKELLAHIERLEAQLNEAKALYADERTEGLFDREQQEERLVVR